MPLKHNDQHFRFLSRRSNHRRNPSDNRVWVPGDPLLVPLMLEATDGARMRCNALARRRWPICVLTCAHGTRSGWKYWRLTQRIREERHANHYCSTIARIVTAKEDEAEYMERYETLQKLEAPEHGVVGREHDEKQGKGEDGEKTQKGDGGRKSEQN